MALVLRVGSVLLACSATDGKLRDQFAVSEAAMLFHENPRVFLLLTCYGDQMNNRKGLGLETECPAAGASTGGAQTVAASYFWEE